MYDLSFLEEAFSPLMEFGKGEKTFDIEGIQVTIRTLLPEEEAEVTKMTVQWSQEDDKEDLPDYFNSVREVTLSYAILEVNGKSFRDIETFKTNETTPDGRPIVITKPQAIRKLMKRWSPHLLTAMYEQYQSLKEEVDKKASKYIETSSPDLDSEISELEEKLKILKEFKKSSEEERKEASLPDEMRGKDVLDFAEKSEEPSPQATPQGERKPFLPNDASPPEEKPSNPHQESSPHETIFGGGSLENEFARESQELMKRHYGGQPIPQPPSKEELKKTFEKTEKLDQSLDGRDVYKIQAQEIPPPSPQAPAPSLAVNNSPKTESRNPRFTPVKRP